MKKLLFGFLITLLLIGATTLKRKAQRPEVGESSPVKQTVPSLSIPGITRKKNVPNHSQLTPDELNNLRERQSFVSYLETSFSRLPTLSSLKLGKDGDFHHVPPQVIESSEIFGEIADRLKRSPQLIKDGLRFYAACALNEQLVTSIRAVCARNLKDWSKKSRIDTSQVVIPENIERIANVIPSRE
jgi:hypothetical protein